MYRASKKSTCFYLGGIGSAMWLVDCFSTDSILYLVLEQISHAYGFSFAQRLHPGFFVF